MKLRQTFPIASDIISRLELKLLMKSIIGNHARVRIKLFLDGGRWSNHFLSVMMVTANGIVLNDDVNNKIKLIRFLGQITRFMIDKPFDSYNSNLTYKVG